MKVNKEYLTIKEVSQAADVSVQSIYQRLETTLKEYVRVIKGKKYLDIKVLKEVYNIDLEQDFKQDIKDIKQGFKDDNQADTIKLLQDTLDTLKSQLEQKDKQIEELHNLLDQEQQLNAINSKKILELEQTIPEPIAEEPKENKGSWWSRLFN